MVVVRPRAALGLSWAAALLAAVALAAGALLTYADRTLLDSDGFADRTAAALERGPVRDAAARRLTDAAIAVRPNLVAVRPIIELGAGAVVGTAAFRSLVRRGALEAHRSAFAEHRDTVAFRVRDAGLLVADAVRTLRPDAARRVPTGMVTTVARVHGGIDGALLALAERADRTRRAGTLAFGAALVLALVALLVTDSRRASAFRLGTAAAIVGGLVALLARGAPPLLAAGLGSGDRPAAIAAAGVWLDPVRAWALAGAAAGAVVALAAASVVRPIPVAAVLRRARAAVTARPRTGLERGLRLAAAIAAGTAMVAWPRTVLTAAIVVIGTGVLLVATAQLLALAGGPAGPGPRPSARRALRFAPVVLAVGASVALAAALSDGEAPAQRTGHCNGHAALCERRLNEVALLGTHNSMAAAGEPGWLFAAQDAGIPAQLREGVHALLIDTHYGIRRPRGVVTDFSGENATRAKLAAEVGERFVATAERIRRRIGSDATGPRDVFLCHTLCEVGATQTLVALRQVHRFLVRHPEEVLVLSIQDDTSAADTARMIRASGLVDEVYRGRAARPWPTLREMIDRDERVLVLAENRAGGAPWIHHQPAVMQETPFHFGTAAELEAAASCEPNRGGTAGSLLLVNHWVDTTPAPRATIARAVNAREFLGRRIERCRTVRRMLPNVVAVDFYRLGDAAQVVDELNRVR